MAKKGGQSEIGKSEELSQDQLRNAERRYVLEQMHYKATGEKVTSGTKLSMIWAPQLGMSQSSFDINHPESHLDIRPSQMLCKIFLTLAEDKKFTFDKHDAEIFFNTSDWYKRLTSQNPDAITFFRRALLTYLLKRREATCSRKVLTESFQNIKKESEEFWEGVFAGEKKLSPSEIEKIKPLFLKEGLDPEQAWILSECGLAWCTATGLKKMRIEIARAMLTEVRRTVPGYLDELHLKQNDVRSIRQGETLSQGGILALEKISDQPCCKEFLDLIGGLEGLRFFFQSRKHETIN